MFNETLYQSSRRLLLELLAAEFNLDEEALKNVVLEAPRDNRNGDLATNAAMVLAKPLQQNPLELAEKIAAKLRAESRFSQVNVAMPGFINLSYQQDALFALASAITAKPGYARLELAQGEKALVEYVSINPTGPIHVGHGRNAVFGDAIANVLEQAGYEVWREYLVNDAGGQIRALVKSVHARYLELFGEPAELPEGGYPGEYIIEIADNLRQRDGEKWRGVQNEEVLLSELRQFAVDACMTMIKADIDVLRIEFDQYFSEYAMHHGDDMARAVAELRQADLVYEGVLPPPKGKVIENYQPVKLTLFKATAFGLPEDQAIYNRQGKPTYFGQDIAYHYNKLKRGFGLLCTVLGADQAGAFKPLEKVVEILSGKTGVYRPVAYEMVKVVRDGVPVKLSKRSGNIVLLSDVLAEVGKDAFRFTMLTVKPTTPLVFDLAKAVEKTMENPVFYVQYAHARLASVKRLSGATLPKAGAAVSVNGATLPIGWQFVAEARAVMVQLLRYPLVIEQTARALEPHRLTVYAQELAAAVHKWYAAERWWDEADTVGSGIRLQVAQAAQVVLQDVLRLCGVSAPEMM